MWTEQQRALLRGMGLRVWCPPLPDAQADVGHGAEHGATPTADAPSRLPVAARVAAPAPAQVADGPRLHDGLDDGPDDGPDNGPRDAARDGPRDGSRETPPPSAPVGVQARSSADTTAVARLDWPALREAVAACRACSLCESRTQTVFGSGHEQAHWMVVGEAPGEQEDKRGEPFVGPAGQLLDAMLRALALTRAAGTDTAGDTGSGADSDTPLAQRVYIANTLKCRPPRNRNPDASEMARCEPFLVRQIELLRPRIILAMGKFAVQALLRSDEPIGRLRGQVHRYQGVPLVVTYHPAYLLRQPQDKAKAWEDLCLAAEVVAQQAAG